MTGKQKTHPPKKHAPTPSHAPAPANEVTGAESSTAVTTTPDLLSGLPNHPTTRTLRQATTLQLQHEYGNAQVQRLLLSAPVSTVQGNVIQRAITFDEAKKRIRKAGKGWGTDESGIYAAIRECADRGRLKSDPDVQYILKDEMSGHDLWKAYFLLEYGNEAAFPPAVQEVWAATKGAGTDENRIYRALQRLSVADATRLNALPGFQDLLRSELSGKDLNAVRQLLSGDYARAVALHKANVLFVKNELARMKLPANPPLVRNTAEWLEPTTPGATPKNDLYVLTPTHDSAARGKEHGKGPDVAYFGDSPQYPDDTATYEAHIESERNIHYSAASVGGEHLGRKIWVHNPSMGGMSFQEVMVHEVQHDADRHDLEEGHNSPYKSPEESWNRYKTEFRSYWVDGQRDNPARFSVAPGSATDPRFDNQKQQAIFLHMWGTSANDVYAQWLRPVYDKNKEVYGRPFQDLVHQYTKPEGVNLINSPRIDNFFQQLRACRQNHTDLTKTPLTELETTARTFDADDIAHVNSAAALRLQEMMKDNLAPAVLTHIATIVNGGTAPAWVNVNIAGARRQITAAGAGWGTDEQKIYDTIAAAAPAERAMMRDDPTVRRILHRELSGHELWQAQLMLEFGPEAQWPQTIIDIWNATSGAGTDEALIRRTLSKLTRPQVEAIARVEGLRRIIRSELSGEDLTTTNALLEGKYADAVANHQADMAAIVALIRAGLTDPDRAWKAICVKLNNPAKASIHAMTPTHDSNVRVGRAAQSGKTAYFGADTKYPAPNGRYDARASNTRGIRFVAPGQNSETSGKDLYLYEARNLAGNLKPILEVFGNTLS